MLWAMMLSTIVVPGVYFWTQPHTSHSLNSYNEVRTGIQHKRDYLQSAHHDLPPRIQPGLVPSLKI